MTGSPQPTKSARSVPARGALLPQKLHPCQGARASIFQPPHTPTSISSAPPHGSPLRRTGTWDDATTPNLSRKRSRADPDSSSVNNLNTPYSASANGWTTMADVSTIMRSIDTTSPPPFVNTRYTCAGGLDTPGLKAAAIYDTEDDNPYVDFRRRWSVTSHDDNAISASTALGHGKRKRSQSTNDATSEGWGRFVFTLVGGVASKVWEFARNSTFRGFYAGGGQGYKMPRPNGLNRKSSTCSVWEDVSTHHSPRGFDFSSNPVPGRFPQNELCRAREDSPQRPAKKQHTDMGASWVMVPRPTEDAKSSSTVRKTPQPNGVPRFSRPRASSGPRRSILPAPRRSSTGQTGSPAVQTEKSAYSTLPRSRAHSRTSINSNSSGKSTPLSPETQKWMAQRRREDQEANASMRKLNAQLRAMITQGRQALGTKIEIEDGEDEMMEDEGFAEGCIDQPMKW
ncbi:uncharacterized protein K452DRAFT_288152 [Aplosporella prunicola CBS 121167]|uniref:Uncharacterized protein n=1 Tax=Aplosporella prunicola CBS 121167 TaxID=1176127 RepID=A0A6A6BDX9_9PEZI|nr:uncharacterized protein K452DRAFT_288152 [Aplosporella prunicola CBS 121167]KAF2141454.1 hypothetical protein K452DRAFT_288152 [Aplosporella prunicola CBS 121167]